MSKTREDLSRRSKALSTTTAVLSSGKRFLDAREHLNDEDDEDVRLETHRRNTKVDAMRSIARHESRGLKSQEILEDSPNGYVISGKAPPEMPRAIKYYSTNFVSTLSQITLLNTEFAIIIWERSSSRIDIIVLETSRQGQSL